MTSIEKLGRVLLSEQSNLYIALSGGVDSLTLMRVAAEIRTAPTVAVHAISAAVPDEATNRCRELAASYRWQLLELDAGEFNNEHYLANPVNRCYYCKSSLFDAIVSNHGRSGRIATGTNTDDLGDYRPGLKAASERAVWQPYVEAGVDKNMIRRIACEFGLGEISELPAQPCLSSRIETDIRIDVNDLSFVHQMESMLCERLGAGDIRCRIVRDGVVIQLPADSVVFKDSVARAETEKLIRNACVAKGRIFLRIESYRMGSAFLREQRTEGSHDKRV